MRFVLSLVFFSLFLVLVKPTSAQGNLDEVRFFQSFFQDASVMKKPFVDAGLNFNKYDGFSSFLIGAQGGFNVIPNLEIGTALSFVNSSPEEGDSQSGISDILATGRYLLPVKNIKAAVGAYVTLPVGSEEVGASNLNFGAFGTLRYSAQKNLVIHGVLGLEFFETTTVDVDIDFNNGDADVEESTEYNTSLLLGGGVIYGINKDFSILGELKVRTEAEFIALTGGVDYQLPVGGHVRGALGVGLDDGAPDFMIMGSYLFTF